MELKDIDGLPMVDGFEKNYYALRDLPLRQGDVIISTYPKCGSHWVAFITWRIQHPHEPLPGGDRIHKDVPFFDKFGLASIADVPDDAGRTFFTHVPTGKLPDNPCAKYVVVARNPFDCAVSLYHFTKKLLTFERTEEDGEIPKHFFDLFVSGKMLYGSIFDHAKSWYIRRDEPNVHFMVYEKMKANPREEILKLATFLGGQDALLENEGKILDQIVQESNFDEMKKNIKFINPETKQELPVLRKGQVGSYKESLSEAQVQKLRQKMEAELKGNELLELWRHL